MESNKDKKIVHLLENINEKLGEVSEKIDSKSIKEELREYKEHFSDAETRLKKGFQFK